MHLDLPASLEHLTLQACSASGVDLDWVLLEAVKCIRSGAKLRPLTCTNPSPSSYPEGMPWGASWELAEHLLGLKALSLQTTTVRSALGAVAGSAPEITRLNFHAMEEHHDDLELAPICSASLESVIGQYTGHYLMGRTRPPPPLY